MWGWVLVAVGVDQPLSRHDIELIRTLSRFTPSISLLVTKVDVWSESELSEVREFVPQQLTRSGNNSVTVLPYSVRPGFERLRGELKHSLLSLVSGEAGEQLGAILLHKLNSLLKWSIAIYERRAQGGRSG